MDNYAGIVSMSPGRQFSTSCWPGYTATRQYRQQTKVLFLTPFSFFLVSHFGWRLLFCKNNFKFSFFIILIFTLPFFISLFYHIHIFYYYLLCHISFIKLSLSPHQHFYYYLLCHISFIKLSLSPH